METGSGAQPCSVPLKRRELYGGEKGLLDADAPRSVGLGEGRTDHSLISPGSVACSAIHSRYSSVWSLSRTACSRLTEMETGSGAQPCSVPLKRRELYGGEKGLLDADAPRSVGLGEGIGMRRRRRKRRRKGGRVRGKRC
jgi:hypothetical protein